MRFSQLFTKTSKNIPADSDSANARFLEQAGFVHQEMAGVYSYLPLGLRVLRKIEAIIRDEMDSIGGQEILMPALSPKKNWTTTGRWGMDVLFHLEGAGNKEYALGATHEETVAPLAQDHTFSYKDLPFSVYQIQNKFRNEARAKSGILRGREFGMKDLYSFHANQTSLDEYYEKAIEAYYRVFSRLGFKSEDTYLTFASGGAFSKYSHEFQVISKVGEDTIYCCEKCRIAINNEIFDEQKTCPKCDNAELIEKSAIEVGNIFKLGTKFSDAFKFKFTTESGGKENVIMGCYGIGPTRIMGSLVEVLHDEAGIIWPKAVAPYQIHLISITEDEKGTEIYESLTGAGYEVLYDDRDINPGAKFKDADLMGIPLRLVVSARTLTGNNVEWKIRSEKEVKTVKIGDLTTQIKSFYS